jgi:hypothetical protein
MNQAWPILEKLVDLLPEIQRALGEHWPDFARQLHELAKSFENSSDEAALEQAAQQLYALFRKDDAVREILTRSQPRETTRLSRLPSMRNLSAEEIASCFYLLCQQANSLVQQLRLDVAAPDQVRLGESFELAVAVRLPSSPVLTEDDLARTKSGNALVVWPESEPYVQLTVQVIAPACQIHGSNSGKFRLYAGQDSPVFYFMLTPRQVGDVGLFVKLYQEDDWLSHARVHIVCGQVSGSLYITPNPAANLEERGRWLSFRTHLRQTLVDYFDESELRTLCFDLGVDYADLSHETKAGTARELIRYLERRDRLPELIAVGQQLRPNVSWGEVPPLRDAAA